MVDAARPAEHVARKESDMHKKLILSATSLVVTLLVVEAVMRIVGIGSAGRGSPGFAGGSHPRYLFQPAAESGYALRPGFQGEEIAYTKEFDVPVAVDARGLRDQPHPAPDQPLVLTIGDSMTFGEGVPADRTFSAVIEREAGVRVYNAGVPGYSSRQMAGHLRRLLPILRPVVVVMTLAPYGIPSAVSLRSSTRTATLWPISTSTVSN